MLGLDLREHSASRRPAPAAALPATTLPATTLPATTLPATALPATALPATALPATALPATALPAPADAVPGVPRPARWLGLALLGAGIAMVPWLGVLAVWVPATTQVWHWSTAWIGLDALEGTGLLLTGWLLRRGDPRRALSAMATAVLLTIDAWFDVTTSAPGASLAIAVAMAVFAELPIAALCTVLAFRALPRPRG